MKTTIKDVAREANVSIATVSRVINNADNVSAEIKSVVEKAIMKLNYQPNSMARGLKSNTTKTIGVIVSDISISFFSHVIGEVEKRSEKEGYGIMVVSSDDQPNREYNCIKMLMEKRVDGIIIASSGHNEEYLNDISKSGIPVILIDRKPKVFDLDVIYIDKMTAMYNIMELLVEKGHEKIAFISGPRELTTNRERYIGLTKAMYDYELPMDQIKVCYGDYSIAYGRKMFKEIFETENKPTAIIAGSEAITYGIMIEAQKEKYKIPEDISLISFGINEDFLELIKPQISYVEDMKNEIGQLAADALFKKIKNKTIKTITPLRSKIIDLGSIKNLKIKTKEVE